MHLFLILSTLCITMTFASLKSPDDKVEESFKTLAKGAKDSETCSGECAAKDEDTDCWDMYVCCSRWQQKGECAKNKEWMAKKCRVSCKTCTRKNAYTDECKDYYPKCESWSKTGECDTNKEWMAMNCRKSCKSCKMFEPAAMTKECGM